MMSEILAVLDKFEDVLLNLLKIVESLIDRLEDK